jgi:hypothetical protein
VDYHIVWATQIMTGQDEINSLKDNKFEKRQILSELKAIWRECFRDSDEYIDFFLDTVLPQKIPSLRFTISRLSDRYTYCL